MSARTTTGLGVLFIVLGTGILTGHYLWHHDWHTPTAIGAGAFLLLGALLIEPQPVADALRTLGAAVASLIPWKTGNRPPDGPGG